MQKHSKIKQLVSWGLPMAVMAVCLFSASEASAQIDFGEEKLEAVKTGLIGVAKIILSIAGIGAAIYIGLGDQDGNHRLRAVAKAALVVSTIGGVVVYLAS